jgi:hypothetical protein
MKSKADLSIQVFGAENLLRNLVALEQNLKASASAGY